MTVNELLKLIPANTFRDLAVETKVDAQVKKLSGEVMFKLIVYYAGAILAKLRIILVLLKNRFRTVMVASFEELGIAKDAQLYRFVRTGSKAKVIATAAGTNQAEGGQSGTKPGMKVFLL